MKKPNYIKYYQGEKKCPFEEGADDKPELWYIEMAFVIADQFNVKIIREAMTMYKKAKLTDLHPDDGVPIEYKAYLYERMGKFQLGEYADKFRKKYDKYYAN